MAGEKGRQERKMRVKLKLGKLKAEMGKGEEGAKLKLGKLKAEMEDGEDGENVFEMQSIFGGF
jgi:hypothetical protein